MERERERERLEDCEGSASPNSIEGWLAGLRPSEELRFEP